MSRPTEGSVVLNVVWTGTVFPYLSMFVASLMDHSEARFRYLANGCPPEQVALMEQARVRRPDRIVEVIDVSPDAMVAHGVVLDRLRRERHDGDHFCLVDPDIKANGPWLGPLLDRFEPGVAAVTSGREVWTDDNLVPVDHPGVAGEHFFDRQGFVFGSPHLALYRRDALDATAARWGVGLGSAGPELAPDTSGRLAAMGHSYLVYDTGKIVNALLQADGHGLVHLDLPQLVHIGGLSHFLSPPAYRTTEDGRREPDWTKCSTMDVRHAVTRYTAHVLEEVTEGRPPPALPAGVEPGVVTKLERVRAEIVDLVARYGGR